ncbi:MAG: CoA-transferase [Deltaproteobacteria bacterium]|nr:MAG: CoA-transferase [Deltaproteobacteria bacterium]
MSLGDICALACAETFKGDGNAMVSPMAPIPKLGAKVCKALWEPDLVLTDGVATIIDLDGEVEGWMPFSRVFDTLWNKKRHVMMGATQIDAHGNQNISCIGDFAKPKVQLLGVRGAPGNTICHPTSYWVASHSAKVFVERVDMISGIGTDRGAAEIRRVVTNLGVFDFLGEGGRMRVVSLHPGVERAQVEAATGFGLAWPDEVPVTREPTADELAALDRFDPERKIRSRVEA